ncbi:MAG: alkaline phosphatase D family protein [Ilumatobacteraceae bacterium]
MDSISRRMFLVGSVAIVLAACTDDESSSDGATTAPKPPPTDPTQVTETTTIVATNDPGTQPADTEQAPVPATDSAITTTTIVALPGDPFTVGIASGDPDLTSVVLWTRLAPDPLDGGGMPADDVVVTWELAGDEAFANIIATGEETAIAEHGHSIHAVATPPSGTSDPFWYRFRVGGYTSAVGRTSIAPRGSVDTATFVSASCQDFQDGFYAAHRDIAEQQPDFVLWLGDYIYEGGAATVGSGSAAVRTHATPEPIDLAGYRNRYALYKSDANLQSAHLACPWFVIWDDHEVDNNYAGEVPQDAADLVGFPDRRRAAYMAWWEHQPVRLDPPPATGEFRIYRDATWGDLLGLTMLDTRQYRSDQSCGDTTLDLDPACPETFDPDRTLTGTEQEQWLYETVGSHGTTWNVIAQQVVLSNLTLNGAVLNYDQWDGYPVNRDRVLQHLADAAVPNAIVLSGDIHLSGVGLLRAGPPGSGVPVAVEFVDTSITSAGLVDPAVTDLIKSFPDVADVELAHRGYTVHTVTPDSWVAEFRTVDDVTVESSPVSSYKTFQVDAGAPNVRQI